MKISEIFQSIQGEGMHIGTPTTFVRLALCNFSCSWCDTKYSWIAEHSSEWATMTTQDVLARIDKGLSHVCFTGGEPMVQAEELRPLCEALKERNHYRTVETNGSIYDSAKHNALFDFWTVSPKLSSSGMQGRLDVDVLKEIFDHEVGQLKFVIANEQELAEVSTVLESLDLDSVPIVLQPEWYAWSQRYDEALNMLVEKTSDWPNHPRVLPQLHKLIWGERRGI